MAKRQSKSIRSNAGYYKFPAVYPVSSLLNKINHSPFRDEWVYIVGKIFVLMAHLQIRVDDDIQLLREILGIINNECSYDPKAQNIQGGQVVAAGIFQLYHTNWKAYHTNSVAIIAMSPKEQWNKIFSQYFTNVFKQYYPKGGEYYPGMLYQACFLPVLLKYGDKERKFTSDEIAGNAELTQPGRMNKAIMYDFITSKYPLR